jgi:hypothetical protein
MDEPRLGILLVDIYQHRKIQSFELDLAAIFSNPIMLAYDLGHRLIEYLSNLIDFNRNDSAK